MLRRLIVLVPPAVLVACGLLAPPGGYSGGEEDAGVEAALPDASPTPDVVVQPDGQIIVPGSAGTLVVAAGAHDPVSADDDPAWSADIWTGILDDKGHVAVWRIEKSAPIVGPFDNIGIIGGVLVTLDTGLGVNNGRAPTLQTIGWAPGLTGDLHANRVDLPGGLDAPGRLIADTHVITLGGFRTVTDDAGTSTFAVKEVHPATIDTGTNKVASFGNAGVSLQNARANASGIVVGTMMYVVGGRTGGSNLTASVEASPYTAADAKLDGFTNQPTLMASGAEHKIVLPELFAARSHLYVAGGRTDTNGTPTDVVLGSFIKPDGTLGDWSATTALPAPLHDFGVVVHKDVVYVLGGTGANGRVDTVYSATINADGSLGAWDASHAKLPAKRSDIVAVAY